MTHVERRARPERESIHSGHFMVSHFEAEAQDDDDLTGTGVPVPDEEPSDSRQVVSVTTVSRMGADSRGSTALVLLHGDSAPKSPPPQQISIETSLSKLFRCMTVAYRQKLTSPKWNRFKGVKLRWKDKIRLNNVIWRCWHMQFIKKKNTLVCQFASPLDVDLHVKPETTILEGKYWKRRAEAVTAEYKKWRMFHMTRLGRGDSSIRDMIADKDTVETFSLCDEMAGGMLMDEDYINFMSDTLFSTITSNQPFAFPDTREIARGAGLADFIQPSLGPLQPNLDDFMDTLEPFQELLSQNRLPPVPEETSVPPEDTMYRNTMHMDLYTSQPFSLPGHALPAALPSSQMSSAGGALGPERMQTSMKSELQSLYAPAAYPAPAPAPPAHYDSLHSPYPAPAKSMRQYPAGKIPMQPEPAFAKSYTAQVAVMTPAQTAPETVSLLQQPMQQINVTPTTILSSATRPSYSRERPSRPRIVQYSNQLPSAHYQTYQPQQQPSAAPYMATSVEYAKKTSHNFKLPAQNMPSQQISVNVSGPQSLPAAAKESFRSNSLPLGAQLGADWTITAPAPAADLASRQVQAARVGGGGGGGVVRRRSRSSGGVAGPAAGAGGGGRRVPPPLTTVASEPALPQASVMLAQLLTSQHSQSMYKLNVSSEEVTSRPELSGSPRVKQQNSPADLSSAHSGSPGTSPPLSPRSPGEPRRATHLHAEQKRRYNIKSGFDTLQALIPHLNNNPAVKVSKAAMLQKGADYIKQLKAERSQIKDEMESLRMQIDCLNNSISNCHSLLPATGAPVSRARAGRLREMFGRHVAARTLHNWKYWIFSIVAGALVESFSNCVSCGSSADLVRSTLLWAEQHCSLVEMRPAVLSSLRVLCSITDILTHPERLPEEARAAASAAHSIKPEPV